MLTAKERNKLRAVFVIYAKEILHNVSKDCPELTSAGYRQVIRKVMLNMCLPTDNPNFINTRKYMPFVYDEVLFNNGHNNSYDSVWLGDFNDEQRNTVYRQALANIFPTKE